MSGGKKREFYGVMLPDTGNLFIDQLNAEFGMFAMGRTEEQGGLGKYGHFMNIVEMLWNNPDIGCKKQYIHNPWAERFFRAACEERYLGVAGCASAGKSDPAALWAIVNYLADPTHTKVIIMSTTIAGAKLRIWKTMTEYWTGLSQAGQIPGKALWSMNLIKGPSYDFTTVGEASGIQLLASEKSKEKESLEKVIGIKAPKTDGHLGREGKLILLIDEMTGAAESLLHASYANLDSNTNFQMIGLGNPNSLFDSFGLFCEPKDGWDSINEDSLEWETKRGLCIRLDAQHNPRITEGDERLKWMPTQAKIDQAIAEYGPKSLFFNRMFRAVFTKEGEGNTIYSAADFISSKAFDKVTWGYQAPVNVAFLDPSFTEGGDRCILYFGKYGYNSNNVATLFLDGYEALHINLSDQQNPHNYQVARQFRDRCKARGVAPGNAGFDCTGAGGPFGDIVSQEWSPLVKRVNFSGSPSSKAVSNTNKTAAKDFYANRVTELWYAAKPLMAAGQLKGFPMEVAKEICMRENFKGAKGEDTRKLKVETKRELKARTGESPDLGDSCFGLVEVCRNNFGFRKIQTSTPQVSIFTEPGEVYHKPTTSWASFAKRNQLSEKRLSR